MRLTADNEIDNEINNEINMIKSGISMMTTKLTMRL